MEDEVLEAVHLFISHLSNLVLVLPLMLPRYRMGCQMTSALPETESLSLHKRLPTLGFIICSDCLCSVDSGL